MSKQGFMRETAEKMSLKRSQPGAEAFGGEGRGPGGGKVR